jgi:hypothetical protein
MAQTERNFTLKKGETTIDIRLRELAESHDSRLTDELRKISETLVGLGKKVTSASPTIPSAANTEEK